MTTAPSNAPTLPDGGDPPPPWGLGEVAAAALATLLISGILASIVLSAFGLDSTEDASLKVIALVQMTLWVGMVGSIAVVLRIRGGSVVDDLRLAVRATDVPLGIALGVACQLILVPLVSAPWTWLIDRIPDYTPGDLEEPACRLADKADDRLGVVLLFAITVIGAPIVEELFFRGFTQRAAVARLGRPLGVVLSSVLFGLTHFQAPQLLALVVFGMILGYLVERTGRLGPSIVTHMAFNATTVVMLVVLSSSGDRCRDVLSVITGVVGG